MNPAAPRVVIDTQWVLDLCVFLDPRAAGLRADLDRGAVRWLVCEPMLQELDRVLGYPAVARRLLALDALHPGEASGAAAVRAWVGRTAERVETPTVPGPRCRDPDDQVFIDLACAHGACLLSKDKAVLALKGPLRARGVTVRACWSGETSG